MFDFDLEISELFDDPNDEKIATLIRKLNELRRYYDQKSTLNLSHSETIIDLFRVCARKDKILSQALEGDFTGFIFDDEDQQQTDAPNQRANALEQETEMDTTNVEPHSNIMEVESQTKLEWLCNKKVMMSNFETLGMVRALLWTLWIGLVLVLLMISMNYEMLYAVKQKCVLMQMIYICMDLHTSKGNQRNCGSVEQSNWSELNSKDTPTAWTNCWILTKMHLLFISNSL